MCYHRVSQKFLLSFLWYLPPPGLTIILLPIETNSNKSFCIKNHCILHCIIVYTVHLPLQLWWVSYWWCGTVQINARKCISSSFVHFRKPRILITSSESEEKATFTFYSCCFILRSDASRARNENLRPLLSTNIPPISGNYGLRNHFWPLESGFLSRF